MSGILFGLTQSIDVMMLSLIRAMPYTFDLFIGNIWQMNFPARGFSDRGFSSEVFLATYGLLG